MRARQKAAVITPTHRALFVSFHSKNAFRTISVRKTTKDSGWNDCPKKMLSGDKEKITPAHFAATGLRIRKARHQNCQNASPQNRMLVILPAMSRFPVSWAKRPAMCIWTGSSKTTVESSRPFQSPLVFSAGNPSSIRFFVKTAV